MIAVRLHLWPACAVLGSTLREPETRVAEMIGKPKAVRAVARACASNPVALVIPCHRVIFASGKAGGYRWGSRRKRQLLEQEQGE